MTLFPMTPLLLFSYALALAGGLLLIGLVAVLLFAAVCWLMGGRRGPAVPINGDDGLASPAPAKPGGITGRRDA